MKIWSVRQSARILSVPATDGDTPGIKLHRVIHLFTPVNIDAGSRVHHRFDQREARERPVL